jgi:hypothetical protein
MKRSTPATVNGDFDPTIRPRAVVENLFSSDKSRAPGIHRDLGRGVYPQPEEKHRAISRETPSSIYSGLVTGKGVPTHAHAHSVAHLGGLVETPEGMHE